MKKVSKSEGKTWQDYMKADIILLMSCTAIYFLQNWRNSPGAKLEQYLAQELNILQIYDCG